MVWYNDTIRGATAAISEFSGLQAGSFNSSVINAAIVMAIFLIIAEIVNLVSKFMFKRLKNKDQTGWSEILGPKVYKPIVMGIILIGAIVALSRLIEYGEYELLVQFLITLIIGIVVALSLSRSLVALLYWYVRRNTEKKKKSMLDQRFLPAFSRMITYSVYFIVLLSVLSLYGASALFIALIVGFLGLGISFAVRDVLRDMFSGARIYMNKIIMIGDIIELKDGTIGRVEDVDILSTFLVTEDGNSVVIPNIMIALERITNYGKPKGELSVQIDIEVSGENDLSKVQSILEEVAKEVSNKHAAIVKETKPEVVLSELPGGKAKFTCIFRIKSFFEQKKLRHSFLMEAKERFSKERIKHA